METRTRSPLTILVVDDHRDGAESTAAVLRLSGYEVRIALSPREALELAVAEAPDVVLLDIGLPQMDGYQLAQRLCAVLRERPVLVAVTGYGHLEDRSRAEGFDYHFLKPVDPVDLERILADCAKSLGEGTPVAAA
ncbi:MAG: response regulator [Zavarzinella sp.]|nr:response regulator [Zavarzinella sp.]